MDFIIGSDLAQGGGWAERTLKNPRMQLAPGLGAVATSFGLTYASPRLMGRYVGSPEERKGSPLALLSRSLASLLLPGSCRPCQPLFQGLKQRNSHSVKPGSKPASLAASVATVPLLLENSISCLCSGCCSRRGWGEAGRDPSTHWQF